MPYLFTQVTKSSVLFFILFSLALTGCSTEPDSATEAVVEEGSEPVIEPVVESAEADIAVAIESEKLPLDLSLPDNIWTKEDGIHDSINIPPKAFAPSALFDQEEDSNLSFMMTPSFEIDEDPSQLPQLDGGSVSMEIKTK
jgi:hypothetical protein